MFCPGLQIVASSEWGGVLSGLVYRERRQLMIQATMARLSVQGYWNR